MQFDEFRDDVCEKGRFFQFKREYFTDSKRLHITLLMLNLRDKEKKDRARAAFLELESQIKEMISINPLRVNLGHVGTFDASDIKKCNLMFLKVIDDNGLNLIKIITDFVVRKLLDVGVISQDQFQRSLHIKQESGLYVCEKYHMTFASSKFLPKSTSGQSIPKTFDGSFIMDEFQMQRFDDIPVKSLEISTRDASDNRGFYRPLCKMTFR